MQTFLDLDFAAILPPGCEDICCEVLFCKGIEELAVAALRPETLIAKQT